MTLNEFCAVFDFRYIKLVEIYDIDDGYLFQDIEGTSATYPAVFLNYLKHKPELGELRVLQANTVVAEHIRIITMSNTGIKPEYETAEEYANRIWGKKETNKHKEFYEKVKKMFDQYSAEIGWEYIKRDPQYWNWLDN